MSKNGSEEMLQEKVKNYLNENNISVSRDNIFKVIDELEHKKLITTQNSKVAVMLYLYKEFLLDKEKD